MFSNFVIDKIHKLCSANICNAHRELTANCNHTSSAKASLVVFVSSGFHSQLKTQIKNRGPMQKTGHFNRNNRFSINIILYNNCQIFNLHIRLDCSSAISRNLHTSRGCRILLPSQAHALPWMDRSNRLQCHPDVLA